MSTKSLLTGCAVGCAVVVFLLIGGGFIAYRYYLAPQMERMMAEMQSVGEPGVVTGAGFLEQEVFLSDERLGMVSDIALGKLDSAEGIEMVVASGEGAAFATKDGEMKSFRQFQHSCDRVDIIDVEGDGVCEFMEPGSWGSEAALVSHGGELLWTYGGESSGVNDMCAGDVDGDGRLEFAVGLNGSGGVHLVDSDGALVWRRRDENVWQVEMLDTDGDGSPEILHTNASGQLTVRDASGDVLRRARPTPEDGSHAYFSQFAICNWPTKSGPRLVLAPGPDTVGLFDDRGSLVTELEAPDLNQFAEVKGVPIKLEAEAPEYFAVLATYQVAEQAALYLYDADKALVYHEILAEPSRAIAAIPIGASGAEAILIGGEGRVLKYTAAAGGGQTSSPTAASSR